jgi:peptidoglycan/LPS O-acetylase OafA/YrhL
MPDRWPRSDSPASGVTFRAVGKRDGYFDALRALALLRVVAYHTLALWWLHVAFPAIGVMFALAGSLMATSLSRSSGTKVDGLAVVGSRLRRLLPPVWLYGLVAVLAGWEMVGQHGLDWSRLPFWFLPLRDPHESAAGSGFVDTLWYLRTYVWFVLLSPLALQAYRRSPRLTVLAPIVALPLVVLAPGGLWLGRGEITAALGFGTCWLLGYAHQDGSLRRLSARICWLIAVPTAAVGLALLVDFSIADPTNIRPDDIGYALWSAAVVLLVLRWRPDMGWLRRTGWLDRLVAVVNARAVTIYLWHDAAIVATGALLGLAGLDPPGPGRLVVVIAITTVVVFATGWVEDMAAGRRPTVLPKSTSERQGTAEGENAVTENRHVALPGRTSP